MTHSTKQLFIAATRQNDGKTMVSLGLFRAIHSRFERVAYMKPVGQQYIEVEGNKIDKDACLFQEVYDLKERFTDMSPIAVPQGFTQNYIDTPHRDDLSKTLLTARDSLQKESDFLLIEGTGHAGVGSVFDMSNADVAHLFGSKVILVSWEVLGARLMKLC